MAYIPVFTGNFIIGIMALANRKRGFTREILNWIKPLITIAGNIKLFRKYVDRSVLIEKQEIIDNITLKNEIISKIIDNSDEYIFVIDITGKLITCSQLGYAHFQKMYGCQIVIGDNYLDIIKKTKNGINLYEYWDKTLNGERIRHVFNLKTFDNTLIFLDIYFSPVYKNNKIIAAFCMSKNITDIMAQKIELEKSQY